MVTDDVWTAMASGGSTTTWGWVRRYSVDGRGMVPHFETMLYDQAGWARTFYLTAGR